MLEILEFLYDHLLETLTIIIFIGWAIGESRGRR